MFCSSNAIRFTKETACTSGINSLLWHACTRRQLYFRWRDRQEPSAQHETHKSCFLEESAFFWIPLPHSGRYVNLHGSNWEPCSMLQDEKVCGFPQPPKGVSLPFFQHVQERNPPGRTNSQFIGLGAWLGPVWSARAIELRLWGKGTTR